MKSGESSQPNSLSSRLALVAIVGVLLLPVDALAHGSCTGARMRNIGNRCRSIARCYVREALGHGDVPSCVAYELERLEAHFQKTGYLYPDCHPFGDPPDVISALDNGLSAIATQLQLGSDRCSRAKMDGAGKICLHLLADCEAPAEVDDVPVDPACRDEQGALLTTLYDKAELKLVCSTADDDTTIHTAVQGMIDDVVTELNAP